jgi:hypothetical protein
MRTFLQTLFFFFLTAQICFGQWVQVGLNNESIKEIAIKDATIFAVTLDSGKVFRSIDNGSNWTMILDSCAIDVAISQTGKVFMVKDSLLNPPLWMTTKSKLFASLDNGNTWSKIDIMEQLIDSIQGGPRKLTISPSGIVFCYIYNLDARSEFDYIAKSTDDGVLWTTPGPSIISGNLFDFRNQSFITIGRVYYYLCCSYTFIHLSSDYGNNWAFLGWPPYHPYWIPYAVGLFSNNNIIIVEEHFIEEKKAICLSTDMCSTWTVIDTLINSQVGLSYSSGSSEGMLIGTEDLGVFLFSDMGDSLGSRNEGLTNLNIKTLTLDNNGYVYAGTENGVWRRPLTEIVTSVDNEPTQPTEFALEQNYPNPFNPSTTFRYSIPTQSKVVIKVFDVLGNEVATLMDEEKSVGTYELTWNAENLSSGIYFYQLKAGEFISTKKMILLK